MRRDLQVVLKIAERCNINCSYCYYFNAGNDAPYGRPSFMSEEVARGVVRFLEESAGEIEIGHLRVILHGGEPLMIRKDRFRAICQILRRLKQSIPGSSLVMITNGTLIDSEWIDLFEEFDIAVCVSLDGPPEYHDLERVDFRGRGTYARVVRGIDELKRAAAMGRIVAPSVLTVIDPRFRGDVVYDHVVRKLGIRTTDFRVPMTIYDTNPTAGDIASVGSFLTQAFREWVKDDDPGIRIRIFSTYLFRLLGRTDERDINPSHIIVGVGSDGTMVNDDLMQVLGTQIFDRNLNICRNSMADYLAEVTKGEVAGVGRLSDECIRCRWYSICRPSTLPWDGAEMRYKRSNGFQNRLVHCEAYQSLFQEMKSYIDSANQSVDFTR